MDDATITFIVLGAAVALFVWNRLSVGVVAVSSAIALYAAGVIDVRATFAGFGDPTVIFIASLFVISEALDSTGVTTWAGQRLIAAAGDSDTKLTLYLLLLAGGLSAVLTPNGAVAAILPMAVLVAMRLGRAPSKLLMPVAFSAHAGSLLVLTGSPVNVLVADEAASQGVGRFGYFEFALVGVPLLLGVAGLALLLGPRLLPERRPRVLSADLSDHARTLMSQYAISNEVLARHEVPEQLFSRNTGVAEVVIPPRSPLIGQSCFPGMVTDSGDLVVLAVHREGAEMEPGEVQLAKGDTLLLEGSWEALDTHLDEEVLVVDPPDAIRRQVVALGVGARRVIVIVAALIIVLATGLAPPAVAGALAAMALILTRVMSTDQLYRSIAWPALTLIAGLLPLSVALQETGAAEDLASVMLSIIGDAGPYALIALLFAVAALLGSAISNTATALILIPVAVSASATMDVSVQPVLMVLTIACSAAFLTPIATPGNLMVEGPAGYRFGDYWRFGLPMMALFFTVALVLVPLIWAF
jgi:di/tricarboxylate transporter